MLNSPACNSHTDVRNDESEKMLSQSEMEACLIGDEPQKHEDDSSSSSEEEERRHPGIIYLDQPATSTDNTAQAKRYKKRAVTKSGYTNLHKNHVPLSGMSSLFQDMFTFLIECQWRVLCVICFSSFLVTWFLFGVLYWLVAFGHGDLTGHELHDPKKEPCVTETYDFISCFLFSMETQYSSGYGTRSPTTECPEAVFLVGIQSIFGSLLQAFVTGVIFAKFARPKMRSQAVLFSERAVICMRDRTMCLMFRVGDFRKSRLLGATLNARLLQHRISPEGERLPHYQHSLDLSVDSSGSEVFLLWPLTVVHVIDAKSPLYDVSAADLAAAHFEIVVVLSGTVETMGQDTEARSSYLASEIVWGQRFRPLVKNTRPGYILDYRRFNDTVPIETPRCSARQLHYWTHNYVLLNKDKSQLFNSQYPAKRTNHQINEEDQDDAPPQTVDKCDIFGERIKKDFHTSLISLMEKRLPSANLVTFSGDDLRRIDGYL